MECPYLLVLSLAPLVARASQEPGSFLRLGGREKKIAVPVHGLTAGPIDRAKVLGMAGEHHFQHLGRACRKVFPGKICNCSFQATFLLRGAGLAPRDWNDDGGVGWLTRLCRRAALTIRLCLMPWRRFFPRSPR